MRNFVPVFVSRGVVQISALCRPGARQLRGAGRGGGDDHCADRIYMLPVSLFGMSVSAAELPAMSSAVGTESGDRGDACGSGSNARAAADRVLHRAVGDGVSSRSAM